MNDLLFCKINLKMFPCQSSETWRRLGNADKVPRIPTLSTCRHGTVTSVPIRHERWTLHHPVQCLRLLWWGNTHELSIENRFSNRSTWTFETAWEFEFPEPSIFIAEWYRYHIMLQYIFQMFSDLNFVSISRRFSLRALRPTHLLFIHLVTLIIFSKVKCYKLWLFASSSSFLLLPASLPRRLL